MKVNYLSETPGKYVVKGSIPPMEDREQLAAENERLKKEVEMRDRIIKAQDQVIKRAKNINPIERPNFLRVLKIARDACMNVRRVVGGWLLELGSKTRKFKKLKDIWELLIQDNWYLSDIFEPPISRTPAPRKPERHPNIAPKPVLLLPRRSESFAAIGRRGNQLHQELLMPGYT